MTKPASLTDFDTALQAYLASRRALGGVMRSDGYVLNRLRTYLLHAGYVDLSTESFAGWRRQLQHCTHNTQLDWSLRVLRFCRYRRRREPQCFLPQRETLGRHRPHPLPTPIEAEQVSRLLDFIQHRPLRIERPLFRASQRMAIVLMYTAGLRRSEVARLCMEDIDAETGILRIHFSKFHKSRTIPLSSSATQELQTYLTIRAGFITHAAAPLALILRSDATRGYSNESLSNMLHHVIHCSGIWANAPRTPRVHDFRHAFAVEALRRWYEEGRDVQSELPKLSMYMGHVSIASTAYYLRFMPAVVDLASQRFADSCDGLIEGGAA